MSALAKFLLKHADSLTQHESNLLKQYGQSSQKVDNIDTLVDSLVKMAKPTSHEARYIEQMYKPERAAHANIFNTTRKKLDDETDFKIMIKSRPEEKKKQWKELNDILYENFLKKSVRPDEL